MNYNSRLFCSTDTVINLEFVTQIHLYKDKGRFLALYFFTTGTEEPTKISTIQDARKFICHYFAFNGTNIPENFMFILGIKEGE